MYKVLQHSKDSGRQAKLSWPLLGKQALPCLPAVPRCLPAVPHCRTSRLCLPSVPPCCASAVPLCRASMQYLPLVPRTASLPCLPSVSSGPTSA